jgi:hypothetical protein
MRGRYGIQRVDFEPFRPALLMLVALTRWVIDNRSENLQH